MRQSTLRRGACVALLAAIGCAAPPDARPRVRIRDRTWFVELATTGEQRYRGLSGRPALAEDAGMLFVYPYPRVLEFCMRGCDVPIDVAFLGADLRVVSIHQMRVEADRAGQEVYSSGRPAQYALEVRGGALRRAGVTVGDRAELLGDIPATAKADEGP